MSLADEQLGLTAEQLERRRSGITATDAVILAGCSNWGHPLEVWESKMGAPAKPATLAMQMGNACEPVIMNLLRERYALQLWPGATIRHRIVPYFLATPDRFVHDAPIVVEADGTLPLGLNPMAVCEGKLVGFHLVKEWRDETDPTGKTLVFPDSVAVQTCWQMAITNTKRNYVGALLGGWRDDDFHHLAVDFNEDLWLGLWEVCERFWVDHVLARKPPPPDASDRAAEALGRIYPKIARPVLLHATDEQREWMRRYIELNAELKKLEGEKTFLANMLRSSIQDANGLSDGDLKATWLPQKGKVSVEKLAAHFKLAEPDLDAFRNDESRVLRVNPLTKKEKAYGKSIRDLVAAE